MVWKFIIIKHGIWHCWCPCCVHVQSVSINSARTTIVISSRYMHSVQTLLHRIGYVNTRTFPTPGHRPISIETSVESVVYCVFHSFCLGWQLLTMLLNDWLPSPSVKQSFSSLWCATYFVHWLMLYLMCCTLDWAEQQHCRRLLLVLTAINMLIQSLSQVISAKQLSLLAFQHGGL